MPNTLRKWNVRSSTYLPEETASWASLLSISPFLLRLLVNRGLTQLADMEVFLSPGLRHLASPEDIPGLSSAAEAVADAVFHKKKIAVWGDYDVDGITATALLADFFRRRDVPVKTILPNRLEEGYGLSLHGIERAADQGVELIITVDCGISSLPEISRAGQLGMDVVVTDHHLPGPQLPACRGLVNPKLKPCSCTDLAGVGIAFFLAASLNRLLPGEPLDVRQFLDLVALGTVADVVPLTGQNRILVKNGLLLLNSPDRPGVKALKEVCGFAAESRLGSGEISFGLAPRINAAGRMGDPTSALELLLTRDGDSAKKLAEGLNALNAERKKEEERILSEAVKQASQCQDSPGLVLHGSWHQGVIGIVASRIVEQFHRPSIVLCEDGDELKGSARSIPGFDLYEGLTSCQDILLRYGGHAQAAGLTLAPDSLESFRELFSAAVREQIGERLPEPTVTVEEELGFDRIDPVLLGELELLQPYGLGNPRPLFASPPLEVRKQNFFGNGKHVGLDLRDTAGKITYRGCAFRQAEHVQELSPLTGKTVRVAFTPRTSTFNGMSRIDLAVKHFLEIT